MPRKKTKARSKKLLANDVLEGRVDATPEDLFRLIHRVNPTGRGLSRRAAQRRYDQKHKLQSVLVSRFGEEHVVVQRTAREGVVSLDHPSGTLDACHAPLVELEPEARSWILRQLDQGGDDQDEALALPDADTAAGAGDLADEDPLAAGRQALARFDYVSAERLLTTAFEANAADSALGIHTAEAVATAVEAAVALLALKVESLGLDEEALALGSRLSPAARGDAEVRSLLALAAARQGRRDLARELLAGLPRDAGAATPSKRQAAAFAALAGEAVRAGDEAAARRWLDDLASCDPAHEAIAAIRAGLDVLALVGLEEAETELERLYREAGSLEAAATARAIADRWPASEVARRVLREAGALRREITVAEHLGAGDTALAEESFDVAVYHYEAVLAEDDNVPDVARRLEQARRGVREQADEAALATAEKRFAGGDLRRSLLAYLGLPARLRERLRTRLALSGEGTAVAPAARPVMTDALSALDDLDTLHAASPRLKAPAATAAVLALGEAQRLLSEERYEDVLAALEPHMGALAAIPRAGALAEETRALLLARRRQEANEAIRQANAAAATGTLKPWEVLELFDAIDEEVLSPPQRQAIELIRMATQKTLEIVHIGEAYQKDLANDDLFSAREHARQFNEGIRSVLPAEAIESKEGPGEFLDDSIREEWRMEVESWPSGKALPAFPGALPPRSDEEWPTENRWLDGDGRRLVLAHAFVDWLFVRVVDVLSGQLLHRVSMHTPRPLGAPLATCWDGGVIWIGGARGGLVALEPDEDWRIAEWRWLPDDLPAGQVERTVVLPRSPYVWVVSRDRKGRRKAQVLEREAWRVMRQHKGVRRVSTLYGLLAGGGGETADKRDPRVFLSGKNGTFLCAGRGHLDPGEPLVRRHAVAAAADGAAVVALLSPPTGEPDGTLGPAASYGEGLGLARFERHGEDGAWRITKELHLPAAGAQDEPTVIAAGGLVWVRVRETQDETRLFALAGESLAPLYSLPVPHESALVGDRDGRHAALVADGEEETEIVPLGREEPRLRWRWKPPAARRLPWVEVNVDCVGEGFALIEGRKLLESFAKDPPSQRRRILLNLARESTPENVRSLVLTAHVLLGRGDSQVRDFIAELWKRHTGQPDVAFVLAECMCRLADANRSREYWKDAGNLMGAIDPDELRECRRHYYHVYGVGLLLGGHVKDAREMFEKGLGHDDTACDLKPLLDLATPMEGEPPKAELWDATQSATRQLMGALHTAALALHLGDDQAALAALQRPVVWRSAERNCLARLALSRMEVDERTGDGFESRLSLACYLEAMEGNRPRHVVLAKLSLPEEELEGLAKLSRHMLALAAETDPEKMKELAAAFKASGEDE